jgi:hypothetical protein
MIPSSSSSAEPPQDRYSVVVLDYPRREKQDIECYCIPSSNLEDHGYFPPEDSERRDEDDASAQNFSSYGRPPQSPASKGRIWKRLWIRHKYATAMKPKSSRGLRGSNRTKKELTEAEMTKYISSQDDLDWSTDENGVPAKPNPQTVSARNSIVQPLVQIYLEDGKEDADDTISAMSW